MNYDEINKELRYKDLILTMDEFIQKNELEIIKHELQLVDINNKENCILIRFNNLKNLNSMNNVMIKEIFSTMVKIKNNPNNFYVLIGDITNKYFCVGADLKMLYSIMNQNSSLYIFTNLTYYCLYEIHKYSEKTITIWNGVAMGGGLSMGIFSKFRIATENTIISMPESKFGFYTNVLFNIYISKILPNRSEAIHMGIFSQNYYGYEAYLKGFATHFVLIELLPSLIESLNKVTTMENVEFVLNEYHNKSIGNYKSAEERIKNLDNLINTLYNFDYDKVNFIDFYERLKYNTKLYNKSLYLELLNRSLLSIKVNFEIALSAYNKNLTYEEKFNLDLDIGKFIYSTGNPIEGIRAYFIDKDKNPKWMGKF